MSSKTRVTLAIILWVLSCVGALAVVAWILWR